MRRKAIPVRGTVFSFVLAIAAACVSGEVDPAGDQPSPSEAAKNEAQLQRVEEFRALGYVAWDSGADQTLNGVTWLDAERVAPGYNLYTNEATEIYLTDLDGERVHTWTVPRQKWWAEHAELMPDGCIAAVCVRRSLTIIDRDSSVLLDVPLLAHHDVTLLPDGGFLVPSREKERYRGRDVWFDTLVELSSDGEVRSEWSTFRDLSALQELHAKLPLDVPPPKGTASSTENQMRKRKRRARNGRGDMWGGYDYYHLNSVEVLPATPLGKRDERFRAGNLLISLRNVNLIAVLKAADKSVLWHWGTDELDLPHMPTMLPDGNILIFDNGKHRGFSRVLEIEPQSGEIVWEYRGDPPKSFFSAYRGSAQRLGNGNTLICESQRGHVFEVTPDGRKVWEFWNPVSRDNKRRRIYRFMRLSPSEVAPLIETLSARRSE